MSSKIDESIVFIRENRDRVLFLESELEKIKTSKEWINAMNNLRVASYNNVIDEAPMKSNNYRIPLIIKKGVLHETNGHSKRPLR